MNISEGRRHDVVALIGRAAGRELLDVHTDPDHHRSVLTLAGESAARAVAAAAVLALDLRTHTGVHPRIGVVDVVPFVALAPTAASAATAARDRFAAWAAEELGVPCFRYGPERTLPELRRRAWHDLAPDVGPDRPHPSAGAMAVGVRPPLVAYNVWLRSEDLDVARAVAAALRGHGVRALGLPVDGRVQVSMNLIDPAVVGPATVYDRVAAEAAARGIEVERAELVGLVPQEVLDAVDARRWAELDLAPDRTIEARAAEHGVG